MSTPTAPLAALTTVFTPPCATSWLLPTTKVPSQYPPFPTTGPSTCDPPSWTSNIDGQGFQYYSPAICPSGFEVGPSCEVTKTRTAEGFPPVTSGETAVYCVPSGHTCTTDTTDFRGGVWGFTRAAGTPTSGAVIVTVGPALQIRFRDEDLSILETHPLTPGLVLAGAATSTIAGGVSQTSTSIAGFSTITRQVTTTISELSSSVIYDDGTASNLVFSSVELSGSQSMTLEAKATETTSTSSSNSSSINPGSLAAIILSSILIAVVLAISSVIILRRNRRNRQNKSARLLPLRQKPWLSRDGGSGGPRSSISSVTSIVLPLQAAELPGTAPVIPELPLGTPLGAKGNPAELNGRGLTAELNGTTGAPLITWSWMSRASRVSRASRASRASGASRHWSARSWKTRSSVGQSSFRWTRSAASMQTASSGRYSGDWESFARGKWGDGLGLPAVPADRPLPDIPKTPGSAKFHIASYIKRDADLNRLSRISDGTFGAPALSPVGTSFINRP